MMRTAFVQFVALPVTLATLGVASVGAQTPAPAPRAAVSPTLGDARWAPWIGCWRSVDDPAGAGARLCVTPAAEGVATVTVLDGRALADDTRTADGRPHAIAEGECKGTETGSWSTRAVRLYRTATVTCAGDEPRTRASVSFFAPDGAWVEVETVSRRGDETSVRVAKYVRAADQKLPDGSVIREAKITTPASLRLSGGFTVDDVIEMSAALPADGVQAAISEAPTPFRLNAKALNALADAGVGERVIDLMIGVTYPEKFVVDRLYAGSAGPVAGGAGFGSVLDPFLFGPMMIDPMGMMNCFSPLGWASSLYWTSCGRGLGYNYAYGYNPYGLYDPWNAGWVNISGGSGGTASASAVEGRVVNGRGYTQVRPVEAVPFIGGTGDSYSGTSSNAGSSSGGSGSSGVSSSGYSGGGGGGGGGDRVAVPRPPGF